MTDISAPMRPHAMECTAIRRAWRCDPSIIGLTAFLTVVDLFATQAILPSLTRHYNVTPAAMGFAVNASTMGMAIAGLVVGFLSPHIDRRLGILVSLVLLAIPTTLLASAPDLTTFTILRVLQGLCMASAFALTLAYLGEQCSSMDAGGAFAAYITGNVASNLIGRLVSAAVVDTLRAGVELLFLCAAQSGRRGAGVFHHPARPADACDADGAIALRGNDRALAQSGAARGLCDRLLHPVRLHRHLHLRQFRAGAAAIVAGADGSGLRLFRVRALRRHDAVRRQGGGALRHPAGDLGRAGGRRCRPAADAVLASAAVLDRHGAGRRRHVLRAGVPPPALSARPRSENRGVASGTYLACYFLGGLVGSAVLGQLFDRFGWTACVAGVGASLAIAAMLTARLKLPSDRGETPMTPATMAD